MYSIHVIFFFFQIFKNVSKIFTIVIQIQHAPTPRAPLDVLAMMVIQEMVLNAQVLVFFMTAVYRNFEESDPNSPLHVDFVNLCVAKILKLGSKDI